jgi:hypothetical protein
MLFQQGRASACSPAHIALAAPTRREVTVTESAPHVTTANWQRQLCICQQTSSRLVPTALRATEAKQRVALGTSSLLGTRIRSRSASLTSPREDQMSDRFYYWRSAVYVAIAHLYLTRPAEMLLRSL